MNSIKNGIIIPSAGSGRRMGGEIKKQYLLLKGRPIIVHTLEALIKMELFDEIVVAVPKEDIDFFDKNIIKKYNLLKVNRIVAGGISRQESVTNALLSFSSEPDFVTVHDGVRPFISKEIMENSIESAGKYGSSITAVPEKNTVKEVSKDGFVIKTLNREAIWEVQTPQTFKFDILKEATLKADRLNMEGTDEASIVEQAGFHVKVIMGCHNNIKITTKEDITLGQAILNLYLGRP